LFDDRGALAYLGVNSSAFSTQGLMTFTGSSASRIISVSGKVLAVSPDSTLSVYSNTADVPNQVFVCTGCNSGSQTIASFLIDGAAAAAFSPDSLKAYIVAGNNLYVYSKTDPLRQPTPPLTAPAHDVAFLPEGGFAYVAGGAASAVTVWRNCDSTLVDTVPTTATPAMIRALPDAATIAVLDPPYLELINVSPIGTLTGCTPLVSNTITGNFNLGQGNFTPAQFIIAPDGSAAYILGQQASNSLPFSFVIVFDFTTQTSSFISLSGNAVPLSASLSPAGDFLFVGADDGAVHIIDTSSRTDKQQITFPYPSNALCYGGGTPATQSPVPCLPDLVAAKP
jgi:WD40 repeat protein